MRGDGDIDGSVTALGTGLDRQVLFPHLRIVLLHDGEDDADKVFPVLAHDFQRVGTGIDELGRIFATHDCWRPAKPLSDKHPLAEQGQKEQVQPVHEALEQAALLYFLQRHNRTVVEHLITE